MFGVLHIVYAVIGGLGGLVVMTSHRTFTGLFSTFAQNPDNSREAISRSDRALADWGPIAAVDDTIRIILAVVLLIAGIQLLQRKTSGVKFTRLWAVTRIIVAIPLVYLTLSIQMEAMAAIHSNETLPSEFVDPNQRKLF